MQTPPCLLKGVLIVHHFYFNPQDCPLIYSALEFQKGAEYIRNLRARIEVLKSYFLMAWEMEFISHGFYIVLLEKIEEISKQASKWEIYLKNRT